MDKAFVYLIVGGLLILVAMIGMLAPRFQFTSAMVYLAIGAGLGPVGLGLIDPNPMADRALIEGVSEVVLIVSLFTAGMKLRADFAHIEWWMPIQLASATMIVTIALLAILGHVLLGLPWGAAVLLGAILAPTDPVLAGDIGVAHYRDRHPIRFGLTGEAGLNDGTAFPFVMLGLAMMGLHDAGPWYAYWVARDLLWGAAGGLAIGWAIGVLTTRISRFLRRHRLPSAAGFDVFYSLGVIALTYGVAQVACTYAFLAVFAAGLAMRRVEEGDAPEMADEKTLRRIVYLPFNRQVERFGEAAILLVVGAMLHRIKFDLAVFLFVALFFFVARPAAVFLTLIGTSTTYTERSLVAWFGVRGVGLIYYLAFVLGRGLPSDNGLDATLINVVLVCVSGSILVHGATSEPLSRRFDLKA